MGTASAAGITGKEAAATAGRERKSSIEVVSGRGEEDEVQETGTEVWPLAARSEGW